jgi:hypothetical protein
MPLLSFRVLAHPLVPPVKASRLAGSWKELSSTALAVEVWDEGTVFGLGLANLVALEAAVARHGMTDPLL